MYFGRRITARGRYYVTLPGYFVRNREASAPLKVPADSEVLRDSEPAVQPEALRNSELTAPLEALAASEVTVQAAAGVLRQPAV